MVATPTRRGWLGALVLVLLGTPTIAALAFDEPELKGDLKAIQGEWQFQTEGQPSKWSVKADVMTSEIGGITYVSKMTLDDAAKPNKSIDFKLSEPAEYAGQTSLGIYKLENNTLTICVARPGIPDRPTQFQAVEDVSLMLELKRP